MQRPIHVDGDRRVPLELVRHDDEIRAHLFSPRDSHTRPAPGRPREVVAAGELAAARGRPRHRDG